MATSTLAAHAQQHQESSHSEHQQGTGRSIGEVRADHLCGALAGIAAEVRSEAYMGEDGATDLFIRFRDYTVHFVVDGEGVQFICADGRTEPQPEAVVEEA
jgi:hypothetical protein